MSVFNSSTLYPRFFLTGFSGLESSYGLISLPIFLVYVTSIAGNITILFIIRTEPSLHQPMYYFLSMLTLTDLGLSTTTLPTMFSVFWFHAREIPFNACLIQMYFIHVFSIIESAVLLAMAFDRFVAIREPLRYAAILTNSVIIGIGLAIAGRALTLVFPASFLLKRLQYRAVNILSYPFCLHQDLIKTTVSSRRVSSIYGLMVVICSMGLDSVLLLLSYTLILGTVLSIASKAERVKALNTCISHICAVFTFYTPMIGLSMIRRYGQNASPIVHVIMANVYLLVPPLMNPIVYSIKTKQIRDRILKKFKKHAV
ncbi:olfactory receptor 51G2 [Otolemur garnettii]|uniref:Olfactory receptor n=1 Tax=Otolemur garnettii TaxID=30611 RepID=B4USL5_OTOGA|nr:olfactory receptor 51G2 [Otolemur garnettii]ACG63599.1 cOR51P3 olfactory receptor family 51 subfamily P-like (predicted) [Otolemur garnettii]